ncbi:integrase core domain protein [Lasius niger]|uniref:Integrase core domain protein n=1 Tax=Lasius niger TaxID=67767 RepID=A0A0J7KKY0_LASNI|nr:integrase core domain protein [Lasius niger]
MLLIKEDLWDVVIGAPPSAVTELAAWTKRDGKARAIIDLMVEDAQLVHIKTKKTAKDTWKALKDYHEKSTLTKKVFLLKEICSMRLREDGDMESHINKMQELVNKLTALGEVLGDKLVVAMLLCSLPDSYSSMITALESRSEDDLTPTLVKGKLVDEHRRRKGQALGGDNRCGIKGHIKKDCHKFRRWKSNKDKANVASVDKDDTMSTISDASAISNARSSSKYPDVAFCAAQRQLDSKWYFDLGSTKHMTNDINFFASLNPHYRSKVRVADKRFVDVYGIGNGEVLCMNQTGCESKLKFENVLYVRDFESGLISVRVLDKEGYTILIKNGMLTICRDGAEFAVGTLQGDMYELKVPDRALLVDEDHSTNCIYTWHRRFGHRDPEAIKRLANEGLVSGMKLQACGIKKPCENCIKGKMTRSPFPKESQGMSDAPLKLIHTDVCGPMPEFEKTWVFF